MCAVCGIYMATRPRARQRLRIMAHMAGSWQWWLVFFFFALWELGLPFPWGLLGYPGWVVVVAGGWQTHHAPRLLHRTRINTTHSGNRAVRVRIGLCCARAHALRAIYAPHATQKELKLNHKTVLTIMIKHCRPGLPENLEFFLRFRR